MSSSEFVGARIALLSILFLSLMADPGLTGTSAPGEEGGGFLPLGGWEPSSSVEVSVSSETIDDWVLNVGDNVYSAAQTTVTVTATLESGDDAQLDVKETVSVSNAADGKMYSSTIDAIDGEDGILTYALVLRGITQGANLVTLSDSNQPFYTLTDTGSMAVDFDYEQKIGPLDNPASDYGIVVTFTGQIVSGS